MSTLTMISGKRDRLRLDMGWKETSLDETENQVPERDESLLSLEDIEDVREALARLADPDQSTITLEELGRELGF